MWWVLVNTHDRTQVFNQNYGWVDRDAGPGPSLFPDEGRAYVEIPLNAEWEQWDGD